MSGYFPTPITREALVKAEREAKGCACYGMPLAEIFRLARIGLRSERARAAGEKEMGR